VEKKGKERCAKILYAGKAIIKKKVINRRAGHDPVERNESECAASLRLATGKLKMGDQVQGKT